MANRTDKEERVSGHPLDAELAELWRRRGLLTQKEWKRLREVVYTVLLPVNYGIYTSLPSHRRQDLIERFFTDRVFLPVKASSYREKSVHVGALQGDYYPRYLIDVYRAEKRERVRPGKNEDISETILRTEKDEPDLSTMEMDALKERGYTVARVAEAATEFLAKSPKWVLLFLGRHHCPDREDRVPLVRLAREARIPAYHTKALELGITSELGGFRNYEDFSATRLGRWLGSLGVAIKLEDHAAIGLMLKILCWVALYKVNEQGLSESALLS